MTSTRLKTCMCVCVYCVYVMTGVYIALYKVWKFLHVLHFHIVKALSHEARCDALLMRIPSESN